MMYCPDDTMSHMRRGVANVLGAWHTFKMAHFLVYKQQSFEIFAPLFHSIIPHQAFWPKPKRLIQIQNVFTQLRLAWNPQVKEALLAARSDPTCTVRMRTYLANIKDLILFTIPAVRVFVFIFLFRCGCTVHWFTYLPLFDVSFPRFKTTG
jgi:hypothetical protein